MEAFLVSAGVVGLAEIGDKTQLLALLLAARYRRPLPVLLGILAATVINHGLAAAIGVMVARWIGPDILRWVLGGLFLAMAAWMLVPDRSDGEIRVSTYAGAFLATLVSFFLAEIGDKTQLATVALAGRFQSVLWVAGGTTLGMLLADAPAVLAGNFAAERLPLKAIRWVSATLFAVLGIAALADLSDCLTRIF